MVKILEVLIGWSNTFAHLLCLRWNRTCKNRREKYIKKREAVKDEDF